MLSETLAGGLKAYGIGEKIRALRLRKKMGLVELGQHTGLSAALLSKIEPVSERRLNAYFAQFEPVTAGQAEPHQHEGAEIVFVITGTLAILVGADEHVLREGDSIYFDPWPLHSYRRVGNRACAAVVVTTA